MSTKWTGPFLLVGPTGVPVPKGTPVQLLDAAGATIATKDDGGALWPLQTTADGFLPSFITDVDLLTGRLSCAGMKTRVMSDRAWDLVLDIPSLKTGTAAPAAAGTVPVVVVQRADGTWPDVTPQTGTFYLLVPVLQTAVLPSWWIPDPTRMTALGAQITTTASTAPAATAPATMTSTADPGLTVTVLKTSDTDVRVTWSTATGAASPAGGWLVYRQGVDAAGTSSGAVVVQNPLTRSADVRGLVPGTKYTFMVGVNTDNSPQNALFAKTVTYWMPAL